MKYVVDLRDLWSSEMVVRDSANNSLADRIGKYRLFNQILKQSIDKNKKVRVRVGDNILYFDKIKTQEGLLRGIFLDYCQARCFKVSHLDSEYDENGLNLILIKSLIEAIWKLEKLARQYMKLTPTEESFVFINVPEEKMTHESWDEIDKPYCDENNLFADGKMALEDFVKARLPIFKASLRF